MGTLTSPATASARARAPRRGGAPAAKDTLRRKAIEKLMLAITQAVDAASEDTLADIVGTSDLRHALAIAPRDIAPPPPERMAAIKAARERTARFREDMAGRAGGMYDRGQVAALLGVTVGAIDKQRQRRQILGVPYGAEIRYPAAQFADGEAVAGLKPVLEAFGDMNPWGQLQLLTTPIDGFGERQTLFDLLAGRPAPELVRQIVALVAGWAD